MSDNATMPVVPTVQAPAKKRGRPPKNPPTAPAVPPSATLAATLTPAPAPTEPAIQTLKVKRVKAPAEPPVAQPQNTLEPTTVKKSRKKAVAAPVPAEAPAPAPEPEPEEEIQTCDICTEPFTSKIRKVINCPSCNQAACSQCVQRYLLGIIDDPHCLHCKHGWPRSLLYKLLTKSFVDNDYAEQRAKLLWQREQSYLPEAQIRVERIKEAQNIVQTTCKTLEAERRTYHDKMVALMAEYDKLAKQKANIDRQLTRQYDIVASLKRGELPTADGILGAKKATTERRQFVRKCTADGCRGMLSSAWKCGLCENYTCPDCYTTKGTDRDAPHTCTKEALELVALLAKDTKPCPKCGEFIFHNGGCDQMWCTACHTPFSWSTLRIITSGNIHNPHYFQWRNTGGGGPARAPGDIPCGGCPGADFLERLSREYTDADKKVIKLRDQIQAIYRIIAHCEDIELRTYRPNGDLDQEADHKLLIEYLLKNVDEDAVRARLQTRERRREINAAIFGILETLTNVGAEMLRGIVAFCDEHRGKAEVKPKVKGDMSDEEHAAHIAEVNQQNAKIKKENAVKLETRNAHVLKQIPDFERLRRFINAAFYEVSYFYGVDVPTVPDSWERIRYDHITRRDTLEKLLADANSENASTSGERHFTKSELSHFDYWRSSKMVEYNNPSSYQTQKLKNGKTVNMNCTVPEPHDPVKVAAFNAVMTEIEKARRKYYKVVKDVWRDVCKEICTENNIKDILRHYDAANFGVAPNTYFPSKDAAIKEFNERFDRKLNTINHYSVIYEIIERINDYNKRVEKYNKEGMKAPAPAPAPALPPLPNP
jgi:hypothetical protein